VFVYYYGNRIVIGDRRINRRPFAATFTSTTIYYKVGRTRLVALRVHALHCFFLRTYRYMYYAVVGSSEFTPRKQWFISLCRRSLNFFPLFAQKNANIIPISWLIKRLKKNEVKFLFFCLCECIMSTRFYNTRVVMIILLLLYRNSIVAVCDYIYLYTRYVKKKRKKKSLKVNCWAA